MVINMRVPFVDLKRQYSTIKEYIYRNISDVLESCDFVYSKYNESFEAKLARFVGVPYAVGCSSGTSALHLALTALNIGPGDEVIVPANSFIATALAVSYTGAKPVFVDVTKSGLIDCNSVLEKVTPNTKAVIPVHLYGIPVDINKLKLLLPPSIYIIEDAAQSLGGLADGFECGSMGDIGCFSFYPAKNLGTCGQGGAVVCKDKDVYDKIRSLVNVGRGKSHYDFAYKGFNYRLDSLKAAFLDVAIDHIKEWNFSRNISALKYFDMLYHNDSVKTMSIPHSMLATFHLFVIELESEEVRDMLQEHLNACGIGNGIHYPIPIHKTSAYAEYNDITIPNVEYRSDRILSLPMHPSLEDKEVEYVCKCINKFII